MKTSRSVKTAETGAALFAGMVPQMLLGALILYIGLNLRKSGSKTSGTILSVIGAVLLGSPFGTIQLLQEFVANKS